MSISDTTISHQYTTVHPTLSVLSVTSTTTTVSSVSQLPQGMLHINYI